MLVLPAPLWRFLILDDQVMRNKCVLIRDTDSRPIRREAAAVHAWLHTDKAVTCIRDHPSHSYPLQAGLWGAHTDKFNKLIAPHSMHLLLSKYNLHKGYLTDQLFLKDILWPVVKNNTCYTEIIHLGFTPSPHIPMHTRKTM